MQTYKRDSAIAILLGLLSFGYIFLIPIARPALIFDEITYSVQSRLDADSLETHGFLYSHLVNLVAAYDIDKFFDFGRMLSVPFFAAQTVLIYVFARQFLGSISASAIAVSTLTFSTNIWLYLFMPESIHFSLSIGGFLLLSMSFLYMGRYRSAMFVAGSIIIGLASLVKVHTVLVLPAFMWVVFYLSLSSGIGRKNSLKKVFNFVLLFFVIRFSVGFLLAGTKGLTILGGYQNVLLDSVFGRSRAPDERSAEGVYFGIGERTYTDIGYSLIDIPYLFLLQAWTSIPILLIAFGVLPLIATFKPKTEGSQGEVVVGSRAIFLSSLAVLANLIVMAMFFAAYVTALGDDHTGRPLFRYIEYGIVLSLVTGTVYLLSTENFERRAGLRTRIGISILIVVAILFGGQATITPGYADSSFVPVLGRPVFWLPLLAFSLLIGFTYVLQLRAKTRGLLVGLVAIPLILSGITAHYEYLQGSSTENNVGAKTGQYLLTGPDPTGSHTMFLGRGTLGFGTAIAEAQFNEKNYRLVLGSTPADLALVPDRYKFVVAFERVIVKKTDEWYILENLGESEIFSREGLNAVSIYDTARRRVDAAFDFDYYGGGAFFTQDGNFDFTFDNPLQDGSQLEICFDAIPELPDPKAILSFGDQSLDLNLPSGGRSCLEFGVGLNDGSRQIGIRSNTAILELEDGEVIGELGVGISSLRLID